MLGLKDKTQRMPLLIAQVDSPQDESTGDFYYRTYAPGVGMAGCPDVYVVNLTNIHRHKEEIMREADVLIVNNVCDIDLFPIIQSRKKQKKLTVYELCDDLDAVPEESFVHSFYQQPENRFIIKKLAQTCDAMQFSSLALKGKYGTLNASSAVFPNQILEVPPERNHSRRSQVVVGWGGSVGHRKDMEKLAEPLMKWIMSRTDVQLHLMCADPIWELFERLPAERRKRTQTGSLKDYYRFLNTIDIGLAPLEDTPFNRCRSDVKFLEYAVSGVVPVVQATGPYLPVVKEGVTGFLFKSNEELLHILDGLVDDRSARGRVSRSARDYVLRERLEAGHGMERIEFYLSRLIHLGLEGGEGNDAARKFERFAQIEGAKRSGNHLYLAPTRFEHLVQGGLLAAALSSVSKASTLFHEAAQLDVRSYLPHLFGASCSGDAIRSISEAIERNPLSVKSWMLLGEEHAQKGDIIRAIECFKVAGGIFPEFELPYVKSVSLLRNMQRGKTLSTFNNSFRKVRGIGRIRQFTAANSRSLRITAPIKSQWGEKFALARLNLTGGA